MSRRCGPQNLFPHLWTPRFWSQENREEKRLKENTGVMIRQSTVKNLPWSAGGAIRRKAMEGKHRRCDKGNQRRTNCDFTCRFGSCGRRHFRHNYVKTQSIPWQVCMLSKSLVLLTFLKLRSRRETTFYFLTESWWHLKGRALAVPISHGYPEYETPPNQFENGPNTCL